MDSILSFLNDLSIESFEHPIALVLLCALPVYAILILRRPKFLPRYYCFSSFLSRRCEINLPRNAAVSSHHGRKQNLEETQPSRLRLLPHRRSFRLVVAYVCSLLFGLSLVCLAIALASPQGRAANNALYTGIDIYFTVDMSASMKAYDFSLEEVNRRYEQNMFTPTRFDMARATMLDFVESRARQCYNTRLPTARCDRIGVVLFAQNAFIATPLTIHYESLSQQLKSRRIDDINASQSAIGDGILKAIASLRHSTSKSKSVILITDGERKGGRISINQAITAAQYYNVKIFPVLIGKNNRAVFGYTDIGGTTTFHEANFPVNFDILKDIAEQTGGQAFRVADSANLKKNLSNILDALEPSAQSELQEHALKADISLRYALLALILGLIAFIMTMVFAKHTP